MKQIILKLLSAASTILLINVNYAFSQDLSTDEILKALAPKKLTRTWGEDPNAAPVKKPEISQTDSEFLGTLGKNRGIKFHLNEGSTEQHQAVTDYKQPTYDKAEIEKVTEITKRNNFPRLEFTINFEFGSAQVSGESLTNVINLSKALAHPSMENARIILGGHTDAKGSDAFNQILSQKRSDSVAQLVAKIGGIHTDRIVPIGYGEHELKNPHDPHAAENRRVEVINIYTY